MNDLHKKAIEIIASTLERLGEPLTEKQKLGMAGSVAVLLEKAYHEGLKDMSCLSGKVPNNGVRGCASAPSSDQRERP